MVAHNVKFCFLLVALTLGAARAQAQSEADLDKLIESIFGQTESEPNSECTRVEPDLPGCNECYPCQHPAILFHLRKNEKINELNITNPACGITRVCCISQSVLIGPRIGGDCGKRVDTGHRRTAPRAVLQGEYPWQAFIYQDVNGVRTILCGATYIHEGSRALLTTATCVRGKQPRDLRVSFSVPPGKGNMAAVATVTPHHGFRPESRLNDIALVTLASLKGTPRYISPVCMPEVPPQHAASCRATASNQYLIITHLPKTKVCTERVGVMDRSQLCATTIRGDFDPFHGSALFCETQHEKSPSHVMYGIALRTDTDSVTTYTNLTNFIPWLYDKIE